MSADLTATEQQYVRVALRYLHVRFGTWAMLAKVLKVKHATVRTVAGGHKTVTASMAVTLDAGTSTPDAGMGRDSGNRDATTSTDAHVGNTDAHVSSDASSPGVNWLLGAGDMAGSCPGLDPSIDVNQNGISDCVENLLQNGQFPTTKQTAPWAPGTNNGTSASLTFSPTDEHNFSGSGSAVVVNIVPSTTANGGSVVSECVPVTAGATCSTYARYLMPSGQPGGDANAATWITIDLYSDSACSDDANAGGISGGSLGMTKDAWDTYSRSFSTTGFGTTVQALKIELGVLKGATGSGVQATFDNVLLVCE
jgi:hypothetical protein